MKKHSPLTVLMPVYNAEKFLAESIESILNQTYSNFEFFILDDNSTDNGLKIIRIYAKNDKRIKVLVNEKNQGEAKCRNILLKNSKTEFIAWMDADDISLPERLLIQMDFLKQNCSIDIVSAHMSMFGDSNGFLKTPLSDIQIKSTLLFGNAINGPVSMIRMEKIRLHKIFYNEDLESAPDYQYWVDCCPFVCFANIDRVLYLYRIHPLQDSVANKEKQKQAHLLIVKNHFRKIGITMDHENILCFLVHKKLESQNLKKIKGIVDRIFSIESFYEYPDLNKKIVFSIFNFAITYQWINEKNITTQQMELVSIPLRQYSTADKLSFYNYCQMIFLKVRRWLFSIKIFGFKNYIKAYIEKPRIT